MYLLYLLYFGFCIGDIIIALNIAHFQITIKENLSYYSLFLFINYLLFIPKDAILHRIASYNMNNMLEQQYTKYSSLDQVSKEMNTIQEFNTKNYAYNIVTYNNISWGAQVIMNIVSTLLSLSYILYKYDYFYLVFIFIITNIVWYIIVTLPILNMNDNYNKSKRPIITKNETLLNLYYMRLHNNENYVMKIMTLIKENKYINNILKITWDVANASQQLPTFFIMLCLPFIITDVELYPVLLLVCRNIHAMLSSTSSFINHMRIQYREFKNIEEFWENKKFNPIIVQEKIPDRLVLTVNIKELKGLNGIKLNINSGDKIRICGLSGSGKTTLVRALLGYIPGIVSNDSIYYNALAYMDSIVYMKQTIREELPLNKLTLRELFYDEISKSHDLLLEEIFTLTKLDKWYDSVMDKNLDKDIDNKISGGEKTRLCLALTMYKVIKNKPQWLILDEPEQGIDMELVPELLHNIISYNPNMTVFIITHLCECSIKKLNLNKVWEIK
jgi:ABC-type Mn2+/Zn2+ transport system ATPase subunit